MLYGSSDSDPPTDIVVSQLSQECYNTNLLLLLISNLHRIDFEVRIILFTYTLLTFRLALPANVSVLKYNSLKQQVLLPDNFNYKLAYDRHVIIHM
jgi:calcium binding protein 39